MGRSGLRTSVAIYGSNLSEAGDSRTWQKSDFINNQLPTQLDGGSVTVNGKAAFVYYISPTQINILTPPGAMSGSVSVVVTNDGGSSSATPQASALSPSFFVFADGQHVAALHADGTLVGPSSLTVPGYPFTPARPWGDSVDLYQRFRTHQRTGGQRVVIAIGDAVAQPGHHPRWHHRPGDACVPWNRRIGSGIRACAQ
ncbi:MAG TPA: IPT/TIG domain-containing protein [Bryobacteraceae bacterium]|nr:IPT/TIG domain-containing protein [Bryobacteraceae bacterium]